MAEPSTDTVGVADVVAALNEQFHGSDARAIRLNNDSEPNVVLLHPEVGLLVMDIDNSDTGFETQMPFLRLNERVHSLRQTLQLDGATPIGRVVLHTRQLLTEPAIGIGGRISISPALLSDSTWVSQARARPLDEQLVARIRGLLEPTFTFSTVFRAGSHDQGAAERDQLRVTLDAQQAAIAQRRDLDLALVQGPPGSGKTLVLAARARWLASLHPDWRIQFLCFNNALVPYLRSLVADHPNVVVTTMWPYAKELGVRFSFDDEAANHRALEVATSKGVRPIADAILIDEAQDFRPSWIAIVMAGLTPGRGGLVMAGDPAQALYGADDALAGLESPGVQHLHLTRPYRSTRNILGAIGAINAQFAVEQLESAPPGEPVELIWAETPAEQARAIAWEIHRMVSSGDRDPGDIAVVIVRYRGTLMHIAPALEAMGIPFTAVVSKDDKKYFDRGANTVKIITPHSAKGHEFPVVFLFALDTLKPFDPTDPESVQRGRAGFVGATRAKDQLVITYTKHNSYLDILSKDETYVRRWLWPDQYEGAMSDG